MPPRNAEKLAEAILQVLKDPTLAQKLREKGRIRAMDFTVERAVEEYVRLVEGCVQQKSDTKRI